MAAKEEFVETIKVNEGIIYKIVRLYAFTADDNQDLYQEIVYQLWKSFGTFKHCSKISTWIYKVALNTAIGHLAREKKRGVRVPLEDIFFHSTDEIDRDRKEQLTALYRAIQQLNPVDKAIMLLYLEENTYEEIAAITGFTHSNIGTRLSRMKNKIFEQFKS